MAKEESGSSRLNAFYILMVLKNHSGRNHPLATGEIADLVNKEFDNVVKKISKDTVQRTLEELSEPRMHLFLDEDIDERTDFGDSDLFKLDYGFYLRCVVKAEDDQGNMVYVDGLCKSGQTKYYYYESYFLDSEIRTIYSSIETCNFLANEDITNLVLKLRSLRPLSKDIKKPAQQDEDLKDPDSIFFETIGRLAEIISRNNLADIVYGYYGVDKNKKPELIPRPGYSFDEPKRLRPIRLMFSNGYYYCLMANPKEENKPGPMHIRVDRILLLEEVNASPEERKNYPTDFDNVGNLDSMSKYGVTHPVMHGGKLSKFELLVRSDSSSCFLNTIVDLFGRNLTIEAIPETTAEVKLGVLPPPLHKDLHEEWYRIKVDAAESGTLLVAAQYCERIFILEPDSAKDALRKKLRAGLRLFDEDKK